MSEATTSPPAAGTFCWNEVMGRDIKKMRDFYSQLFGWTTEEMPIPEGMYTIFKKGDQQVAGGFEMKGPQFEGVPANWLSYIAVDDVDASTKKAEQLGATVHHPPSDIPNVGRFSVIADPEGAAFALFKGA